MYRPVPGTATAASVALVRAPRHREVTRHRWFSIRGLRLATGLTLFTYVGSHLLNHSLGNMSVPMMEAGLLVQKWIWQGMIGTAALYLALLTHFSLGLWAFYERRHFGWIRAEIAQVGLGLCIPFLLMNHLFVTRIALTQFGMQKGYAQELYSFWVAAPRLGVLQVSVLVVAWIHGCIGVYLWLRLKPAFERAKPILLCGAVVLPMLALLGFYQGGRTVLALAHDPAWRAANLASWQVGRPAENGRLLRQRDISLLVALGLVGLVLLARFLRAWRERLGGIVQVRYPDGRVARIPRGFSVLDASRSARIPHASVCGGRARCSTCRIRVIAGGECVSAPSELEQAVLDRVGAEPLVRLACQLRPARDIAVVPLLPPYWNAAALRTRTFPQPGEERFIVVLVADMRESSRLAEFRLPFDAVFIIGRFVNAIGTAVTEAGGLPNHFTGDGLMATFGLACAPSQACRQAIDAVGLIGRNIAALNKLLLPDLTEPIRFGIGVHGGPAVVGEIDFAEKRLFTTLGDAVNVATRLEAMCKDFSCEAVIAQPVVALSGRRLAADIEREVTLRGREAALVVHTVDRAVHLHCLPVARSEPSRPPPLEEKPTGGWA
ncbi:adenylate/guanylate cyclase domain-containing protein [Rhodopila sp.]|uniref:adenylate/guanylate cyclase domain-containing protein n=1 Tax=Rhodopila sp. TaxID=2480087 RepID=UPI003D10884C